MGWLDLFNGATLARIEEKVDYLMALVQVDQTVLDTIGQELGAIGDAVAELVADSGNPLTDADLTVITEPLDRIKAALAAPETPVEEL